jgi:hypothetical protein
MKRAFIHTVLAVAIVIAAAAVRAAAQPVPADEQQALRTRIEQRYDVVPLSGGVALTPKSPRGDVRLIEISDTIAINGVAVSGRELRERVGADAESILRLSYLGASDLRPRASRVRRRKSRSNARLHPNARPRRHPTGSGRRGGLVARTETGCECLATLW